MRGNPWKLPESREQFVGHTLKQDWGCPRAGRKPSQGTLLQRSILLERWLRREEADLVNRSSQKSLAVVQYQSARSSLVARRRAVDRSKLKSICLA